MGANIGKNSEAEGKGGGESKKYACGFHVYLMSVT